MLLGLFRIRPIRARIRIRRILEDRELLGILLSNQPKTEFCYARIFQACLRKTALRPVIINRGPK